MSPIELQTEILALLKIMCALLGVNAAATVAILTMLVLRKDSRND